MAKAAQPPQDRSDQPAHQRAVAIGEAFQSGMGGGAVKLFVEGAVLVQNAVKNVGCDPPRRKTWHFRWQSKTLRGHGASVPIPKFVSMCGPSCTNFGIDRTLANLLMPCGFGSKVRMTNSRHQ